MLQIACLVSLGDASSEERAGYFADASDIMHDHGGRIVSTSRPIANDDESKELLYIVQFDDQAGFHAFQVDPRHELYRERHDRVIRSARLFFTDQFVTYVD